MNFLGVILIFLSGTPYAFAGDDLSLLIKEANKTKCSGASDCGFVSVGCSGCNKEPIAVNSPVYKKVLEELKKVAPCENTTNCFQAATKPACVKGTCTLVREDASTP